MTLGFKWLMCNGCEVESPLAEMTDALCAWLCTDPCCCSFQLRDRWPADPGLALVSPPGPPTPRTPYRLLYQPGAALYYVNRSIKLRPLSLPLLCGCFSPPPLPSSVVPRGNWCPWECGGAGEEGLGDGGVWRGCSVPGSAWVGAESRPCGVRWPQELITHSDPAVGSSVSLPPADVLIEAPRTRGEDSTELHFHWSDCSTG